MTTATATPKEQVRSLIEAARRSSGAYECGIDQLKLLLERGAKINGAIRNARQESGKFKTQCRLHVGGTEVVFFTVFTDEPFESPEK